MLVYLVLADVNFHYLVEVNALSAAKLLFFLFVIFFSHQYIDLCNYSTFPFRTHIRRWVGLAVWGPLESHPIFCDLLGSASFLWVSSLKC